jgi:hypothetical protein
MLCVNRTGSEPHRNICRSHPFWSTCRVSLSFPELRKRRSQLRKPKQTRQLTMQNTRPGLVCGINMYDWRVQQLLQYFLNGCQVCYRLSTLRNSTENNIPHRLFPFSLPYLGLFPLTQWMKLYVYPSDGTAPPLKVCDRFHGNGLRTTYTHSQL